MPSGRSRRRTAGAAAADALAEPTTLSTRRLNRILLARQLLTRRRRLAVLAAVEHLVGLQSQSPRAAYVGLWTRLSGFRPERLEQLMLERRAVRIALMRSTVHLVSARDCLPMRRLTQPAIARTSRHTNERRNAGVDDAELAAAGRELLADRPHTFHELGELLHERWPGCPADALMMGVRELVPLVQVPPRGLWRSGGAVRVADAEAWLPAAASGSGRLAIAELVCRYLPPTARHRCATSRPSPD